MSLRTPKAPPAGPKSDERGDQINFVAEYHRASDDLGEFPPIFWQYPTPRQWWALSLRERIGWAHPWGLGLWGLIWQWDRELFLEAVRLCH